MIVKNEELEQVNTKELLSSFDETTTELVNALSKFSPEELNTIPFEGSWTAGQTGEHLLKSAPGILKIILGNTEPTKRPADEKVKALESMFLDFTKKEKSAKALWPSDDYKEKEKLIGDLKSIMDKIQTTAGSVDLTPTCMDFPFPTLGEMTRWEWVSFVIYHTKKHIHQIKNIYGKIKDKEVSQSQNS